ncbi:MAG TPA: endopeptidase La, partial [Burkholderiales bacterium]|nr:endopeptidase La [Burkholderiales bacterium]
MLEAEEQGALSSEPAAGAEVAAAAPEAKTLARAIPEDALIIVPVRNLVLFPGVILPLTIGRSRSIAAAQEAIKSERPIGVVLQRDAGADAPSPAQLHWVGTIANVLRYVTAPDGSHHVVVQGEQRFRVLQFLEGYPFLVARVERIQESEVDSKELEARLIQLKERAIEVLQLLPQVPSELVGAVQNVTEASALGDLVAGFMDLKPEEKQELLETFDLVSRIDKVLRYLAHRIEVLKLSQEINRQTKESLEGRQREHLLREQMRTIQKELGEGDESQAEIADLAKAIEEAKMPEEADKQARKELKRLERMPEAAAEYSMIRTYLDWLIELPWNKESESKIDIAEARRILDEDHYGLDKIKKRILEYLAVRKLNPQGKSPILCFVGPPGVGKTSLGQSIARATGREFVRASLGGVHDEAEIRGHRRTYIGALPGNIIQAIRKAGTRNPVFMLDEMDKLGAGFHGDPSSALLEVLDPEQNSTFRDNYLAVPFDLSKVMFIGTANILDTIPGPLRDRMEVIQLTGYTEQEKMQIARRYLVKRQLEANGLKEGQAEITDEALAAIIHDYTREAGVRNLEREIGSVFRNTAMRIAEGIAEKVRIEPDDLHGILGPRRFEAEVAMRTTVPGVATGLAWTPVGGDILFIEASRAPGSGKLILTGQLGDVMKESAQAALSLVKARTSRLGLKDEIFEKSDIHIHVPAGATPK